MLYYCLNIKNLNKIGILILKVNFKIFPADFGIITTEIYNTKANNHTTFKKGLSPDFKNIHI